MSFACPHTQKKKENWRHDKIKFVAQCRLNASRAVFLFVSRTASNNHVTNQFIFYIAASKAKRAHALKFVNTRIQQRHTHTQQSPQRRRAICCMLIVKSTWKKNIFFRYCKITSMTEIINCENIIMSKNSLALFLLICNYRFGFYKIIYIWDCCIVRFV